jgi:hypothetical protein
MRPHASQRLRIMHRRQHLPFNPSDPTIEGNAPGPATKILDADLDMEVDRRYFLSVFLAMVKRSNLVRS